MANVDFYCRAPKKARKVTQILAVVAVSVGAFIHGTTVSFPAVAIPSLKNSNKSDNRSAEDAYMPFHVYESDISLIGKSAINLVRKSVCLVCDLSGPLMRSGYSHLGATYKQRLS